MGRSTRGPSGKGGCDAVGLHSTLVGAARATVGPTKLYPSRNFPVQLARQVSNSIPPLLLTIRTRGSRPAILSMLV